MVASWFVQILYTHIICVVLSGGLFCVRGGLMLARQPFANAEPMRWASRTVDALLLTAAILLTLIVHQYPFVQAWLTVKVVLLVVYIVLGTFALRRGRTRGQRAGYFIAALAVFAFIISVAVTQNPYGAMLWLD